MEPRLQSYLVRWLDITFRGLAVVFLSMGTIWLAGNVLFFVIAMKADGQIVDLQKNSADGDPVYAPVYVFNDDHGLSHRVVSVLSSNPPTWSVGERIHVAYLKANTDICAIDSFMGIWFIPLMCMLAGIFALASWILLNRFVRARLAN